MDLCPACNPCNPCNCPVGPDFIERNGTWLLGVLGIFATCVGGMFTYFLKSRCTRIRLCGSECTRQPIALDPSEVKVQTAGAPLGTAKSSDDE